MPLNPTNAFVECKQRFDAALAELAAASEDHFDTNPDTINWGNVGWLSHMTQRIQALADQALRRGEYAEDQEDA